MAQVAQTTQQRINHLLESSFNEWEELPEIEATINQWDQLEQMTFIEEWTLAEERLKRLACYAATDTLSHEQQARYNALQQVVTRNRPIIERLRAS
ncbi:MAG TPA: hypothetical protein VIL85_02295 [Thermomicrobiales bacterium]